MRVATSHDIVFNQEKKEQIKCELEQIDITKI